MNRVIYILIDCQVRAFLKPSFTLLSSSLLRSDLNKSNPSLSLTDVAFAFDRQVIILAKERNLNL